MSELDGLSDSEAHHFPLLHSGIRMMKRTVGAGLPAIFHVRVRETLSIAGKPAPAVVSCNGSGFMALW